MPNRRQNEPHVFCFSITCWFQWEFANSWKSWGGVGQEVSSSPFHRLWDLQWDAFVLLWDGSQPESFSEESKGREGSNKAAC